MKSLVWGSPHALAGPDGVAVLDHVLSTPGSEQPAWHNPDQRPHALAFLGSPGGILVLDDFSPKYSSMRSRLPATITSSVNLRNKALLSAIAPSLEAGSGA